MPLNDSQIERYSRQIIAAPFGGVAQERLLRSRVVLAGEHGDIAQPLAYLVGAGIGQIHLMIADDPSLTERICADMRELNPDSTVSLFSSADQIDFSIALIGSGRILEQVRSCDVFNGAGIAARLDAPQRIAILPAPPPCIRCARTDILAPFGSRSEMSSFAAMLATVEALKMAARHQPASEPALIELRGYATSALPFSAAAPGCVCAARAKE